MENRLEETGSDVRNKKTEAGSLHSGLLKREFSTNPKLQLDTGHSKHGGWELPFSLVVRLTRASTLREGTRGSTCIKGRVNNQIYLRACLALGDNGQK